MSKGMDLLKNLSNSRQINDIATQVASLETKQWNDFLYNTTTSPWLNVAVNAGTGVGINGTQKHPGIFQHTSSVSANSGYAVRILSNSLILGGGEKTTIIFKTATTITGVIRRMGFHNAVDNGGPSDGVFVVIVDGVIGGRTTNNAAVSSTGTSYTCTADTWYRLKIELNANATLATYTLYADDSSTVLWTDTLSTNIPIGRVLGHGDICTYGGTAATALGYLDYMDIMLPNARRVV